MKAKLSPLWASFSAVVVGLLVAFGLPAAVRLNAFYYGSLLAILCIVVVCVFLSLGGGRRFRLVWAFSLSALVGFLVPTSDAEHFNYFREVRACILNTIDYSLLAVVVMAIIDINLSPPRRTNDRQFSLAALLGFVTATAGVLTCAKMFLQILAVKQ